MRLVLAGLVCVAVLTLIGSATASVESLTLDQAQPVTWGEQLSFTGVYTSAEKKDWPPRIHNPELAVSCSNGFQDAAGQFGKEQNLGAGWWQGQLGYIIPTGAGSATCTARLEFTDSNGNTTILASTQFSVD